MKKNWKLVLFTVALITALLACNLPGRVAQPPVTDPNPVPPAGESENPPEQPPAEEPEPEPQPEEPPAEEPPPAESPSEPSSPSDGGTDCNPDSEFIDDVTIPDGTLMNPGTTVTKTWRIRNDGTCTWTSEFVWVQLNYNDSKLTASLEAMPLPAEVAPGDTLDVSVVLSLDNSATLGTRHVARFQMRSPGGELFGTHPFATVFASPGNGVCPVGPADTKTFINVTEQYCFLYPEDYDAYVGATDNTIVKHPATPGVNEEIVASVSISNHGSTGGLGTNEWADTMVTAWKAPATNPPVKDVEIGIMTGRATDGLPGMVGNRIAFLVHDGDGFVFTIMPMDSAFGDKKQQAIDLWDLVRGDFTFFGP